MFSRVRVFATRFIKNAPKRNSIFGICFATSTATLATLTALTTVSASSNTQISKNINDDLSWLKDHFNLLYRLQELAPKIDATKMLNKFLEELNEATLKNTEHGFIINQDYVEKLFNWVGIKDTKVAKELFEVIDWNKNKELTPYELAAAFTLFNIGSDLERYTFLFHCLDLTQSGTVDKEEFREVLTSLLEIKYHLLGLENPRDPSEIYQGIEVEEYRTMAKFKANQLVRSIFIYADQHRRDKLNLQEFIHWCYRGGEGVRLLKELLFQTHEESSASEMVFKYAKGHMPET